MTKYLVVLRSLRGIGVSFIDELEELRARELDSDGIYFSIYRVSSKQIKYIEDVFDLDEPIELEEYLNENTEKIYNSLEEETESKDPLDPSVIARKIHEKAILDEYDVTEKKILLSILKDMGIREEDIPSVILDIQLRQIKNEEQNNNKYRHLDDCVEESYLAMLSVIVRRLIKYDINSGLDPKSVNHEYLKGIFKNIGLKVD